jgi:hypothetical protein
MPSISRHSTPTCRTFKIQVISRIPFHFRRSTSLVLCLAKRFQNDQRLIEEDFPNGAGLIEKGRAFSMTRKVPKTPRRSISSHCPKHSDSTRQPCEFFEKGRPQISEHATSPAAPDPWAQNDAVRLWGRRRAFLAFRARAVGLPKTSGRSSSRAFSRSCRPAVLIDRDLQRREVLS